MKFISLFRRNHNQGSSEGVRSYQQPPVTMESAVFPPNNKQETEKFQPQQQPCPQQQQQEPPPQQVAMDGHGATAVGMSPIGLNDRPLDLKNIAANVEELERLREEVEVLKVNI